MIIEIIGSVALLLGAGVVLIGSIGLINLPDFYCRLHSAGVIDSLGAWLVLSGLLLHAGSVVVGFKLLIIGALIFFISPASSHALAKTALEFGDGQENGQDGGSPGNG